MQYYVKTGENYSDRIFMSKSDDKGIDALLSQIKSKGRATIVGIQGNKVNEICHLTSHMPIVLVFQVYETLLQVQNTP